MKDVRTYSRVPPPMLSKLRLTRARPWSCTDCTWQGKGEQKKWLPSNFRLKIDGLETARLAALPGVQRVAGEDGETLLYSTDVPGTIGGLLDLTTEKHQEVSIQVVTDRGTLKPRLESVSSYIHSAAISPAGKRDLASKAACASGPSILAMSVSKTAIRALVKAASSGAAM